MIDLQIEWFNSRQTLERVKSLTDEHLDDMDIELVDIFIQDLNRQLIGMLAEGVSEAQRMHLSHFFKFLDYHPARPENFFCGSLRRHKRFLYRV